MKLHRFIGNFDLTQKELEITNTEVVHQIKDVLKLKTGESVILGDGQNKEVVAVIKSIIRNGIIMHSTGIYIVQTELEIDLVLACSILKKERFEWVVEKATELGVVKIIPLQCERTVKTEFNRNRLQKVIKEAAEQSGRGVLPQLLETVHFKKQIDLKEFRTQFLFDSSGQTDKRFKMTSEGAHPIIELYIGPEGGWTERELTLAIEKNVKIISLGNTTLRAETAALSAVCWAKNL